MTHVRGSLSEVDLAIPVFRERRIVLVRIPDSSRVANGTREDERVDDRSRHHRGEREIVRATAPQQADGSGIRPTLGRLTVARTVL